MNKDQPKTPPAAPAEVLDTQPSDQPPQEPKPPRKIKIGGGPHLRNFKNWYLSNKKLSIPLTVLLVVLLVLAIPFSRYKALGLVIKKNISINVVDAESGTPVSAADVRVDNRHTQTDGRGTARLTGVAVGPHHVVINKTYYKTTENKISVGLGGLASFRLKIEATGRPVSVRVTDRINGKALENVAVKAREIEAKTDQKGVATLIVPAALTSLEAKLSLSGYNNTTANLQISDKEVKENKVPMTPVGKIYFLSKLSGKIDVVKTNLDGSQRETVLAGTGKEEDGGTVLLAARNWKYLALLSRREGTLAKLYLIETDSDKLTTIDEGNAYFDLVGWSDDYFIYQVTRGNVNDWQPHKFAIKSYNAVTKQLSTVDQNEALGDGPGAYAEEQFGDVYAIDDKLVYYKIWYRYGSYFYDSSILNNKLSGLYIVRNDGAGKKSLKTVEAKSVSYISTTLSKPGEVYLTIGQSSGTASYAEYSNGTVKDVASTDIPDTAYNTYLLSPAGKETFWSEPRDGKNSLFVGDKDGAGGKQIASLSEFQTYGWFTDKYLLVSKSGSELYIMAKSGPSATQSPLKISDYHKPLQTYYGYGGGYGGL